MLEAKSNKGIILCLCIHGVGYEDMEDKAKEVVQVHVSYRLSPRLRRLRVGVCG